MNMQTIQASHVISTCLFAYYLGADTFIVSFKEGFFPETTFTDFTMSLAIVAFILILLNALVITDEEDASGFFGKAVALTKGIIYKKTNYFHLVILIAYVVILMLGYFAGGLADTKAAIVLTLLVCANLFVPFALLFLLDPERIKSMVGEPSEIEKALSNKGADLSFSEAAVRIDFWYMSFTAMVVIGASRMFDENAQDLGLHIDEKEEMIQETYGVFEVIGACVMGSLLTFFRSKLQPSMMVVLVVLIGGLG